MLGEVEEREVLGDEERGGVVAAVDELGEDGEHALGASGDGLAAVELWRVGPLHLQAAARDLGGDVEQAGAGLVRGVGDGQGALLTGVEVVPLAEVVEADLSV